MDVYLASVLTTLAGLRMATTPKLSDGTPCTMDEMLAQANILDSFAYCNKKEADEVTKVGRRFILDSGAYTWMVSHPNLDWDDYIRDYADFIIRNDVRRFFELDIDSIVGYERVKEIRAELERLTGMQPIPVWHKSRGLDEFRTMCDDYDYVAIGGLVTREITASEYRFLPTLIQEAHDRGSKIHGLGFTNTKWLGRCHFDSVDSSAWARKRFGQVVRWTGSSFDTIAKPDGTFVTYDSLVHNFNEYVRFSRYAEMYL